MADPDVLLVVDPSREAVEIADRLEDALEDVRVVTAEDVSGAATVLGRQPVACVVSSYAVPDESGDRENGVAALLDMVTTYDPNVPFVVFNDPDTVADDRVPEPDPSPNADSRGSTRRAATSEANGSGPPHGSDRRSTLATGSGTYDPLVDQVRDAIAQSRGNSANAWEHRLFTRVYEVTRALVGASARPMVEEDACRLLVVDKCYDDAVLGHVESGEFRIRASAGEDPPSAGAVEDVFPPETLASAKTLRVRVSTASEDGSGADTTDPSRRSHPTTFAAIPVKLETEAYGTLIVGTRRPNPFGPSEQQLLAELGETLARAIYRSETRERLEKRERQLEEQNERLQHFARMVSHDLRNPLQVVLGRLGIVEEDIDREDYEPMRSAVDRMSALIDDVLRLANGCANVVDPASVEVEAVAMDAWLATPNGGDLVVAEMEPIRADPSLLEQLLANLFTNAIDHVGTDVTVRVERTDGGFAVEDDGPGIPPDDREKVFDLGYSAEGASTGYGLAIVAEIVAAHGWTIQIEDGDDSGARFEITGVELAD